MPFYRPTWAEISRSAFSINVRQLKSYIGDSVQLIAVLKADGYGHGAKDLAPLALQSGASSLGVSSLEEGLSLRQSGVTAPILILGGLFPLENFRVALENKLTPTVASFESARVLQKVSTKIGAPASFHLKVDTGMGRIGVSVEEAEKILLWAKQQKNLSLAGVYSHFACSDSDRAFTLRQLKEFEGLKRSVGTFGFKDSIFHLANSSGTLLYPASHLDGVRLGLALYGESSVKTPNSVTLSPVLSWKTRVIFLKRVSKGFSISYGRTFVTKKKSEIATLPVGYADGVPRKVSNKGFVLVKGRKCRIVGRVTMDHVMVDVTGLSASIGEPVTLIGRQGDQTLSAKDWANWSGTISYEIFCGISKRVPRVLI